jgi:hypothetical protein
MPCIPAHTVVSPTKRTFRSMSWMRGKLTCSLRYGNLPILHEAVAILGTHASIIAKFEVFSSP